MCMINILEQFKRQPHTGHRVQSDKLIGYVLIGLQNVQGDSGRKTKWVINERAITVDKKTLWKISGAKTENAVYCIDSCKFGNPKEEVKRLRATFVCTETSQITWMDYGFFFSPFK